MLIRATSPLHYSNTPLLYTPPRQTCHERLRIKSDFEVGARTGTSGGILGTIPEADPSTLAPRVCSGGTKTDSETAFVDLDDGIRHRLSCNRFWHRFLARASSSFRRRFAD